MSKEKRRVPRLRFPGFTGDWEQRKLGDITKTNPFKSYLSNALEIGEYEVIQQGEIPIAGYADGIPCYNYENITIFGDHTLSLFKPNKPFFISSDGVKLLSPLVKIDGQFFYYLLEKYKPKSEGYKRHFTILKNCEAYFPNNIEEQTKISTLLNRMNSIITLHQRKLNHLILKKKSLLQKLFPKNGNRYPELRFPGFTDTWEQHKLDDIAKIKTGGGTPKTANPEYWSGNIPWIQSSDLVEGDIVHVNINKFINNNALKNSAAKLISRDSIALVTRVGVGKVAVINQDFTTSQDFLSLSDFDENDIKFLAYQLYRLMQENAKVLQGTSIKGITKTELIEQSISIPSSGQEQNLISNVLSKIDSIITLHQRKLDHLQLKKKALLQQLFV